MNLIFPSGLVEISSTILNMFLHTTSIERRIADRAKILLNANASANDTMVGKFCGCSAKTIKKWRKRAILFFENWTIKNNNKLQDELLIFLGDANRSGSCKFAQFRL